MKTLRKELKPNIWFFFWYFVSFKNNWLILNLFSEKRAYWFFIFFFNISLNNILIFIKYLYCLNKTNPLHTYVVPYWFQYYSPNDCVVRIVMYYGMVRNPFYGSELENSVWYLFYFFFIIPVTTVHLIGYVPKLRLYVKN